MPVEDIDLVVTPAMGFDMKGNRLGRGGSYYDRFFTGNGLRAARCGFAFEEQLLDVIPATANDEPVDFVVTDAGVTYFSCDVSQQQQGE
jgi:5-formyltetrahydrofolate cyclo-ligase